MYIICNVIMYLLRYIIHHSDFSISTITSEEITIFSHKNVFLRILVIILSSILVIVHFCIRMK